MSRRYSNAEVEATSKEICRIKLSWATNYDKETDTFATLDTSTAVRKLLEDQMLGCVKCRDSGYTEDNYSREQLCYACFEGYQASDGKGNFLQIDEGDVVTWYVDGTFAVQVNDGVK